MANSLRRIGGRIFRLSCDVSGRAEALGVIVSHEVIWGSFSGARRNVLYKFTSYIQYEPSLDTEKLVDPAFDAEADALSMYPAKEQQLADQEYSEAVGKIENTENPDKAPTDYMPQVDFDRKVMGYMMTVQDPHKLDACLPFWQAVQPRNGNNASQRASNLGVPLDEYNEVADRMDAYFGVSSFLTDDLAAVWPDIKEAWE